MNIFLKRLYEKTKGKTREKRYKKLLGKNNLKIMDMFLDNSFLTNVPIVAYSSFTVTAAYDILNLVTSYYRVIQANDINDKTLDTAKYIQNNIDESYPQLKDCK